MYKALIIFLAASFFTMRCFAQEPDTVKTSRRDSLNHRQDSLARPFVIKPFAPKPVKEKTYHPDSTHLPHTAVMRSLKMPGWGQVYNHQWWKVPLIYGGLGALGYYAIYNRNQYRSYEAEAVALRAGQPGLPQYQAFASQGYTVFQTAADGASRNFQLCILGFAGVWGINIIDAYIQSKFIHSYTMDNNFGMRVSPGIMAQPSYGYNNIGTFTPVLKVSFTLK